jgi:hypothetical protein
VVLVTVIVIWGLLAVLVLGSELSRRASLRRYERDELAHLRSVALATGGRLEAASKFSPHVEIELAGLRCCYGNIHAFPPGFDVLRVLEVEGEWFGPAFGVWPTLWMTPGMRNDAARTPFEDFQHLERVPGCEPPRGWVVLGEQNAPARELWERVRRDVGELLPHLSAVAATPRSGLRIYFPVNAARPPSGAVSTALKVVSAVREFLRTRTPRSN